MGECKKNDGCLCFDSGAECDPDLCHNCFSIDILIHRREGPKACRNNEILFQLVPKTIIGDSTINAGYGLFIVDPVDAGDMVI